MEKRERRKKEVRLQKIGPCCKKFVKSLAKEDCMRKSNSPHKSVSNLAKVR